MKNGEENIVTLEELEKSWNDSKAALAALLGDDEDDLQKSTEETPEEESLEKGGDKEDDDEEDEDEDDDMEKSIEDSLDEDPEAAAAMDVEPFLRGLVKSIDERFNAIEQKMSRPGHFEKSTKALAKAMSDLGDQQVLIAQTVEAIGGQPVMSKSVIRKSTERFENTGNELNMTKDQILTKSLELRKAGKLGVRDVTKIENRLNKGIELPENIKTLLMKEAE